MDNIVLRVNYANDLDEVMLVAEEVFKPNDKEREKYHQKSEWDNKIKDGLLISASIDNKIVGFGICYKRESDLHIWNVGVLDKYRKIGVWQKMYNEIVKFAQKNNYEEVSLSTYKDKFPGMYSFCNKTGFMEYKTETDPLSGYTKSMFSKKLI